jgi:hypothetical protein
MNHLAIPRPPAHLLRIAESVDEHVFHLDTSQEDEDGECPVLVYGPGAEGRIVASTFLDFLRRVCGGLAVPHRQERLGDLRPTGRPGEPQTQRARR